MMMIALQFVNVFQSNWM